MYVKKYKYETNDMVIYCIGNDNNAIHVPHREGGPAIEHTNGDKHWYLNGKLHREDGPAIELSNGNILFYYDGIMYSNIKNTIEWLKFIKTLILK